MDNTRPSLAGKRVTVMGLGSFGGGLGAVKFLASRDARITITDLRTADQLADSLAQLGNCAPEALHLGGHVQSDFTQADMIVVSPPVPPTDRHLGLARDAGAIVTSEMNLFWQFNRGTIVGITGSNGKSTTTAMTHAMLAATGRRCWLGGNIGKSLLPEVDAIEPGDWVILELSSFQLEDLDPVRMSPHAAIVTNFAPNHLDRHITLDAYRQAKQAILRCQQPTDWAVLNQDDADVANWPTNGRRLFFGLNDRGAEGLFARGNNSALFRINGSERELPLPQWLTLPGVHNLQNALGAACAALALGAEAAAIESALRNYRALPHRLELVGEMGGRRFYNDSLATTPESTQVALAAFDRPIVLLAGGYDKGVDLSEMARAIAEKPVKHVVLMGQTAPALEAGIRRFDVQSRVSMAVTTNFAEAWQAALAATAEGDILLLSPGCASYDWFRNFADRGEQFRQRVAELKRDAAKP